MATFLELQNQIANDLRRSNLTAEIKQAVLDAIDDHSSERFWWTELTIYTLTITTDSFDFVPFLDIQEFIRIDEVRAQQALSGGSWYTVKPADGGFLGIERLRSTPSTGQPARWATEGNTFHIWPTPTAPGFPLKIYGHYRITPLVNNGDSNPWTTNARNLIRYTALKRLFGFPIRDMQQMQIAEAMGTIELEYLRRETERRNRTGRMAAYG